MSAPETGQSHTAALQRLILGIAGVPSLEGDHRSAPMPLPDKAIAQRVCARYCQDILPGLPFTTTSAILSHLRTAYDDSSPYSAFLIGTILATTAVYLSPASTPNAVGLYRTGLSYLEFWFNTSLKVDMIQYLEASVVLAQFGSFVGDEYVDTWSLSGLAVRIAVDLGLHKSCETESKRRLFWSAYALDRKKAVIDDLPVAMSDRAVEAELPRTPQYHPFELYRILSEIHNLKDPVTRVRLETLKTTLDHWNQDYQASAQSPSRLLQSDHGLAVSSLEKWFIAAYDTH
ncbi:Fc.00g036760.m01.CDS01 [Cosmosporella sp. VM-42]